METPRQFCYNGYFNITDENNKKIVGDAIEKFMASKKTLMDRINTLFNLEIGIALNMAKIARRIMEWIPKSKVILSVNYSKTISIISKELADFDPIILMPGEERVKNIEKFQSDVNCRLAIMGHNAEKGGISLDDTVGDSPRFMLISSGGGVISDIQRTAGINRCGTKSNSTVIRFFGKHDKMKLLDKEIKGGWDFFNLDKYQDVNEEYFDDIINPIVSHKKKMETTFSVIRSLPGGKDYEEAMMRLKDEAGKWEKKEK